MNEDTASLEAAIDSMRIEAAELYEENSDLRKRLESAVERLRTAHFQEKTLLDKIERLTAERNEARQEVCDMEGGTSGGALLEADKRGWDCFKENTND